MIFQIKLLNHILDLHQCASAIAAEKWCKKMAVSHFSVGKGGKRGCILPTFHLRTNERTNVQYHSRLDLVSAKLFNPHVIVEDTPH